MKYRTTIYVCLLAEVWDIMGGDVGLNGSSGMES